MKLCTLPNIYPSYAIADTMLDFFQIPGNLVPISQIASVGGVASINAQLQAKSSPQTTPTGQPTPILPNTPMSPPSGLPAVAINARPILPQHPQGQQQRKISGGRTLGEENGDMILMIMMMTGGCNTWVISKLGGLYHT